MSFFGINVATRGLFTAKTALNVTNHNIANAETKGYSRQVAEQKAIRALPGYGIGMIGTGSEVVNVKQLRNQYFDVKLWNTSRYLGEYSVKNTNLRQLETILDELSGTGFNVEFNRMFEQIQNLSTNPNDPAYRATFRDAAVSFGNYFNSLDEQLRNVQRDMNFAVKTKVDEINFTADQLSSLNAQIANIELTGVKANDLRDERANLIDKLSQVVNVKVSEIEVGTNMNRYIVTINGQTLVDGQHSNYLEVRPRAVLYNPEDEPDLYDIYWRTGQEFNISDNNLGGELKGYLDLRDGNNGQNFKGAVLSRDDDAHTITIGNMNRTDIPKSGQISVNNVKVNYNDYTINPDGSITFELDPSTPMPETATTVQIGNNMGYKGIPYYMAQLNEFVRTFAMSVNKIHTQGQDNSGNPAGALFSFVGYTGTPPLDENDPNSYNGITANNFTLDRTIMNDLSKIATAMDASLGVENNDILLKILELKHDINMFSQGKPESFMQALTSELAIDAKQANNFTNGQQNIILAIENQRLSFSGVDLNEETTNMLRFQHAYNLAAKMISVMNEIYDVTINRMGV
ncbi:flagellar hook-associated protein 1 FlgK [Natranaerovirga pectinivora]|uniref:Flagellar hook-associated protein 1 n=1 Tax=Natranaerovirga pectinivora TaxID=682400 RepID=A0A4R3MKM4_9FIRM|nr:flagellar hook-associated protein FlgK [Natranaerovirga pectinivora]TCT14015.1 flagellar hook-associated protein 1 FlgK [Natranaerovirga pectinivora]